MSESKTAEQLPGRRESALTALFSLYGMHGLNYILPIVTIAYLARVLGPEVWGLVAVIEAVGKYLTTLVEYGFTLSATRQLAETTDPRQVSRIMGEVTGAKVLLVAIGLAVALAAFLAAPTLRLDPRLFAAGCFWGAILGFSMIWYYQGIERIRTYAMAEAAARIAAVIAILVFVRAKEDAWLVFVIQGAAALAVVVGAHIQVAREFGIRIPTSSGIIGMLREGGYIFLFRGGVSMYRFGNAFILSLFMAPAGVAIFAAAEKIGRALSWLVTPYAQAIYPRVVAAHKRGAGEADGLVRQSFLVGSGLGIVIGSAIALGADFIIMTLYGSEFREAAAVLRIFAILPVLVALSNTLGMHWLLPRRLDRHFSGGFLFAGACNIILALLLIPLFGVYGMAWSVVAADLAAIIFFAAAAGLTIRAVRSQEAASFDKFSA